MVMEAEKSHDLPSTSWRTRKPGLSPNAWELGREVGRVGTDSVSPDVSPKAQELERQCLMEDKMDVSSWAERD